MVLAYIETIDGKLKKAAFEAVTYAYKTAQVLGTEAAAVLIGEGEGLDSLGSYGASKVFQIKSPNLTNFDSQTYSKALKQAVDKTGASV